MTFEETLGQIRELLLSKQRVSYRALKRQFALDDDSWFTGGFDTKGLQAAKALLEELS